MDERFASEWLVEIFIQYQEEIDARCKTSSPMWLKDALESDHKNKPSVRNAAAQLDAD